MWLAVPSAMACECDRPMPPGQAYEDADLIFSGKVIRVTTNPNKGGLNVVFQLDSTWKKEMLPVTTILFPGKRDCGLSFYEGKKYLVYTKKKHQSHKTNSCWPNLLLEDAGPELVRMGPSLALKVPGLFSGMSLMLLGLGLGGLLFVAFVVLRKRWFKAG